ncbi:MAG TPA: MerR family DNA-binding transcriptional regulator [Pseudonocardiaceae bacterium]|jgi:MerR family redox-sensitive transcriptional activator SoxR|nr:MerR family DNA-binding transcriptional regulator [Pseudonocardiaceae bacterium]
MRVLSSPEPATEAATDPTLTVGDVARAAGIAASAVRFYDDNGLLASVRTAGNQRRFHQIDACLVKIIRVAARAGLSVAEIRALMDDLPARRADVTVEDFRMLRARLEADVRERIAALTNVLDDLTSTHKLCDVPTE